MRRPKKVGDTVAITLRVTPDQAVAIRAEAARLRLPVAMMVRFALLDELARRAAVVDPAAATLARSIARCAALSEGTTDGPRWCGLPAGHAGGHVYA